MPGAWLTAVGVGFVHECGLEGIQRIGAGGDATFLGVNQALGGRASVSMAQLKT